MTVNRGIRTRCDILKDLCPHIGTKVPVLEYMFCPVELPELLLCVIKGCHLKSLLFVSLCSLYVPVQSHSSSHCCDLSVSLVIIEN